MATRISPKGPDATRSRSRTTTAGTTLIEVLVVIVVLMIGILAVVQIFPGGLRILTLNRSAVMATALARDEAQRVVGRSYQVPEAILPVTYVYNASGTPPGLEVSEDNGRPFSDIGINAGTLDAAGNLFDADGHMLGYWPYLSGPNLFRRIQSEGGRVPAPRQVGDEFGGLLVLQFTPIVFNVNDPGAFLIYGADMIRRIGPPQEGDLPQRYEYYVENIDQPTGSIYLPADTIAQHKYRVAVSYYYVSGGKTLKKDAKAVVTVPSNPAGGFYNVPLTLFPGFEGAELESVRVARQYDRLDNPTDPFTDPYQYKLLDPDLGLILFSDQAYNTFELRNGRRVPLEARVDYDVLDWRVMRDEFRVPDGDVPQVKLALGNLKVKGNRDVDGTVYEGLKLNLQKGDGSTERRDIALMDLDTGGIFLEKSATRNKQLIRVDRSVGLLTFFDADGNRNNGIQGELIYPGATVPVDVNLTGRAIRAMYQARGEWAAQVMKAPSLFTVSAGNPGHAQYYVGGSDAGIGGSPTRIYFSQSEAGQRVTIDQIWYRRTTDTTARSLENQSFVIQAQPADPTGYAYVDVTSADPQATTLDTDTYGYAVQGVRGATVSVRVLWNPTTLSFGSDPNKNMAAFEVWGREWRRTVAETYVRRPGEQ